jgi:hypothetical protein
MPPFSTYKLLLESIRTKPGLYWGDPEHPFTSLVAFLNGYALGYSEAGSLSPIPPGDLVPDDFHKFVTERFGRRFPDGGKGWMTFVREHTRSEAEAFELFFRLREEYDGNQ